VKELKDEKQNEAEIKSFEDLHVYKKLCDLHSEISNLSLSFPKFELHELGSQIRRSSNSIPANIAEGWNNRHINIYLEGINRSLGELQETKHHLYIAYRKGYLSEKIYTEFLGKFNECGKMLRGLEHSLLKWRSKT
jgi:four helix bundle protein